MYIFLDFRVDFMSLQKLSSTMSLPTNIEPILIINLTTEMLYVLNQRMVAQSIDYEKQKQVISEIVLKAFNQEFMDKLYENCDNGVGSSLSLLGLKGGPASSESMNESLSMNNKHKMLCGLFQDFAHASCMRLNGASIGCFLGRYFFSRIFFA